MVGFLFVKRRPLWSTTKVIPTCIGFEPPKRCCKLFSQFVFSKKTILGNKYQTFGEGQTLKTSLHWTQTQKANGHSDMGLRTKQTHHYRSYWKAKSTPLKPKTSDVNPCPKHFLLCSWTSWPNHVPRVQAANWGTRSWAAGLAMSSGNISIKPTKVVPLHYQKKQTSMPKNFSDSWSRHFFLHVVKCRNGLVATVSMRVSVACVEQLVFIDS